MRYKIYIIMFSIILLMLCSVLTYSIFRSNVDLESDEQDIAKFIFNAEPLDELELPLIDLIPGDIKEYFFSVSNNSSGDISEVTVEYELIIKTYHLTPLIIELYKLVGEEEEELLLTCDETFIRNPQNELVCNVPIQEIGHSEEKIDNYKLKIQFPTDYSDVIYSDLIDYINIEINSWQKIEE